MIQITSGAAVTDAALLDYDNTTSGLTASSVQSAVDEVNTKANTANTTANSIGLSTTGTASDTGVCKQSLVKNGVSTTVYGSVYMEDEQELSASESTSFVFTNSLITADSVIDIYFTELNLMPDTVTTIDGECTITFPPQKQEITVGCRIYIK